MSLETSQPSTLSRRGLALSALVLAVLAIAVVASGLATRRSEAAQLRERADADAVRTVNVISPSQSGAAGKIDLPGRIEAHARAPLYARVSGYLKRWTADIGTPVKAGQLLAEIETPELDQQLLQAQAELASAKANAALAAATAKRWQALLASDSVSRQEADEKAGDATTKQSVVNALQANVDRIVATRRFTSIVAPFAGVVTARNTDVGALINVGGAPGSELFVVSDVSRLRVYVNVPQSAVASIKVGSKARLSVPEQPGKVFTATVQSRSQVINAASGSMLVQLVADGAGTDLLPGGAATVSFDLPRAAGTLSVPPGALIFGKDGLRVATVGPDNKVVIKPVKVLRDLGPVIELASGLAPDDRVIDSPPDGVSAGDVVRVVQAAAKAAAAPASATEGKR